MSYVDEYLTGLETAIRDLSRADVQAVVDALLAAWREDRQVFIIGNGGSAATAAHMMNDLCKLTIVPGKRRFRAIALTDNVPLLTAWGNDASFEDVFVEPLRNLMRAGDVLIVISTSGDSPNLIKAMKCVQTEFSGTVIGITGSGGSRLAAGADLVVRIPSDHIGQQEDGHLIVNHAVSNALAERLRALE
ncbi:MAG: SIS domain-containing protein [Anaerolineales bacterium]|jgi:D-sedoheptulose 7-phosphate isomerase|nr:SIS domain-containing protein [Anaerolineales bacterium]MDP7643220.1 SIS domain-containing protein [Anaerolineales bacterium]HJL70409.1 SIS domain-containing protein [Anaerolineales bacterium]